MARVVQQRSAPPYLLIVFVFLFLISAILAVLGFLSGGEAEKRSVSLDAQLRELRTENNTLKNDLKDLVQKITGQPNIPPASALAAAEKAYENPVVQEVTAAGRFGLARELETLAVVITEQKKTIETLKSTLEEKDQALAAKDAAATEQQKTHEKELADLHRKIQSLNQALSEAKKQRDQSVQDVQETLSRSKEELQQDLTEKEKKLEEAVLELAEKDKKIRRLEEELRKLHGSRRTDVLNAADGQIEKIAHPAGVCYVNLGRKDNVQPGMTLAVYPRGGVKKDNVKGSLVVVNVEDDFSECRITREDKNSPLVVGDEVANIVYHPVRKHVFVVRGLFDLEGTGNPSAIGTEQVKDIIRKAGGIVEDEVGYQTDYIVLGEEPEKPSRPEEDAPASAHRAYRKQLRQYREFQALKESASAMRIPILNTNRFLLLTGYTPEPGPR